MSDTKNSGKTLAPSRLRSTVRWTMTPRLFTGNLILSAHSSSPGFRHGYLSFHLAEHTGFTPAHLYPQLTEQESPEELQYV